MEQTYRCINENCSFPGRNPFEMALNKELVMDDRNMAVVFCPFCKKEMIPAVIPDVTNGSQGEGRLSY